MAAVAQVESYGFMTEWHDPQADILRNYTLTLFVQPPGSSAPNEVQMFDLKQKRTFLRRTPIEGIGLSDLIIGGTVTIFSRLLKITGYMDARTREILTSKRQTLTVTLNAAGFRSTGDMLTGINGAGLSVAKLRLIDMGGPTVVCEVVGDNAQKNLEGACSGQPWYKYAQVEALAAHACFSDVGRYPETATYDNCALCVVRPHAVKNGNGGAIVSAIMNAGLEISAMKMIHLTRPESHELFEVYKGVLPYYSEIVSEMISAPSIFMEVRAEDVVEKLRKLSGPHDVELAQHIMSDSLRAQFGETNAKNGVHCTDLASDGELEVRYVFEILDRVQAV